MKLKSKDEVIIKLIERMEELNKSDIEIEEYSHDEAGCIIGEINALKWILGIPREEYEPRIEL